MVFTAPGIPMLFKGQEFLEGEWFRDTVPLDWDQRDEFHGIVRLYRALIWLRLTRAGFTLALRRLHPRATSRITHVWPPQPPLGTRANQRTTSWSPPTPPPSRRMATSSA